MIESTYQVIANFIEPHKNEIIEGWYQKEYILTKEYQLRSRYTEFGKNIKDQVHYMFQQAIEANFNAASLQKLHYQFGEDRAALSTSLEDMRKMIFSYEEYLLRYLQQAKEINLLTISYQKLFDFSIAIHSFFTLSFEAILSGYMNFFISNIRDAFC